METTALSKPDATPQPGGQSLTLTSILSRERVCANLAASDKHGVLRELTHVLVRDVTVLNEETVLEVLRAREELSSTGLESGVAIPHGKSPGVDRVVACFGRSVGGIDFAALDGKPTHLFFLLMAPEDSTSDHLRALARVARLMKNAGLREALLAAEGDEAVYALLAEADAEL